MTSNVKIPEKYMPAVRLIGQYDSPSAFDERFESLSEEELLEVLDALTFLNPEIHPDDIDEWPYDDPEQMKTVSAFQEAWNRIERGEMEHELIYRVDAQREGIKADPV